MQGSERAGRLQAEVGARPAHLLTVHRPVGQDAPGESRDSGDEASSLGYAGYGKALT